MTRIEMFLMLVQTGSIVADIQTHRQIGAAVLFDAMGVSEDKIPNDMGNSAREFINYEYGKVSGGEKTERPYWV